MKTSLPGERGKRTPRIRPFFSNESAPRGPAGPAPARPPRAGGGPGGREDPTGRSCSFPGDIIL